MKSILVICVILGVLCAPSVQLNPLNEFGVSIPSGFFQGLLDQIVLPAVDDVIELTGAAFPPECCWKRLTTRIEITNLEMPGNATNSFATVVSSSDGLQFAVALGTGLNFHFKLCEEAVKSCVTLFSCNDDVNLELEIKMKMNIVVAANGEQLALSASDASLQLAFPSTANLCAFIRAIAKGVIEDINKDLNVIFPDLLNVILKGLSEALSLSFTVDDIFSASVLYDSNATGTTDVGVAVGGRVPVTSLVTGQPTTFSPLTQIPNYLYNSPPANRVNKIQQDQLTISDSIPNNIIEALYDYFPHHIEVEVPLQGNIFKFHVDIRDSPTVSFSQEKGSFVTIKTRDTVQDGFLRIKFDVDTQIFFGFGRDENGIFLELSPDDFVFNFTVLPPLDPDNFTESIDKLVEAFWQQNIPVINGVLAQHAIKLPSIGYLEGPDLDVEDGYATAFFTNRLPPTPFTNDIIPQSIENYLETSVVFRQLITSTTSQFLNLFSERLIENLPSNVTDVPAEQERQEKRQPRGEYEPTFFCPDFAGFSVIPCEN